MHIYIYIYIYICCRRVISLRTQHRPDTTDRSLTPKTKRGFPEWVKGGVRRYRYYTR